MSTKEEILINVTPRETRVAVVENGVLQELHLERSRTRGIVGNIYKGKVSRVLPGMQAAFVDIGLEKNGFLHAADALYQHPPQAPYQTPPQALNQTPPRALNQTPPRALNQNTTKSSESVKGSLSIQELVHEGQSVYVQVLKDPIGDKGARLTTQLSIPSRHLVYLPYGRDIGISQKIDAPKERERLTALLQRLMVEHDLQGGFIVRTSAESATDRDIIADMLFLKRIWNFNIKAMQSAASVSLVHEDLPLALRALRDLAHDDLEKIRFDSRETIEKAKEFAAELMPKVVDKLESYSGAQPLFSLYSVEQEIQYAMSRKVSLNSGGDLVIDQTEAMTTIDVNTGSYVGKHDAEETSYNTNLEAASEIARQLRLRNLAGIIIVDFIDMRNDSHKQKVLAMLRAGLANDRVKINVTDISPLGLVEITRKRTRESLEQVLCEPCHVCRGRGTIKTVQTVCYEILREVLSEYHRYKSRSYTIVAAPDVIDLMLDEEASSLADLQDFIDRPIALQSDPYYQQQQYDIALS